MPAMPVFPNEVFSTSSLVIMMTSFFKNKLSSNTKKKKYSSVWFNLEFNLLRAFLKSIDR